MEKRTDKPTEQETKDYCDQIFKRLYDGKILSKNKIEELLKEYYETILLRPFPSVVRIELSPLSAWKWIQKNKCENKAEKYMDPSGIMFDYAGYYSYLNFFHEKKFMILEESLSKKLKLANELLDIYKIWSFDDCVVVSQKPISISMNNSRLHNETTMSVEFADGFGVYSLNGISVPEYVVKTSRESFTKEMILSEENADVRREILRKLGPELTCKILDAKVVDSKDDYELLIVDLDNRKRPYLKMRNPSIEAVHIEGVHPSCLTVESALAWRNGTEQYKKPVVLT